MGWLRFINEPKVALWFIWKSHFSIQGKSHCLIQCVLENWDVWILAQHSINAVTLVSDPTWSEVSSLSPPACMGGAHREASTCSSTYMVCSPRAAHTLAQVCSLRFNPTLLEDYALKAQPGAEEAAGWSTAALAKSRRLYCKAGEAGKENEWEEGKEKGIKAQGTFAQA